MNANAAPEKLPIHLPADDVRFLREMCEAAEIAGGAEGFVDAIIGDMVSSTLRGSNDISGLIFDAWTFKPDEKKRASIAVQAVVDRWRDRKAAAGAEQKGGPK